MSCSRHVRLSALVLVSGLLIACGSSTTASPTSPAVTPPANTTAPVTTVALAGTVFESSSVNSFDIPMRVTLGSDWQALTNVVRTVTLVHVGKPATDQSQWWSGGISIVDGALVHQPDDVVSDQPEQPTKEKFIPWPADFFAYVMALPHVKVDKGPEPITIGGIQGTQLIVETPPMHPLLWLKDDFNWLGGGPTGVDPASKQQFILLNVRGTQTLLQFGDDPATFDQRLPLMQKLYDTFEFPQS